ncbi:MAG TPA: HIG1 domain-containing protein [Sphingopyxis sp.]|nr:HIG1 domain-containing protein [Sphingopyxis sp.]
MEILLILAVVASALFVLASLGRGLFYFSQGHKAALEGTGNDNLKKQNQMMMARVKWQAITVILLVVVGVLLAAS